jgi:hypothetical protein
MEGVAVHDPRRASKSSDSLNRVTPGHGAAALPTILDGEVRHQHEPGSLDWGYRSTDAANNIPASLTPKSILTQEHPDVFRHF